VIRGAAGYAAGDRALFFCEQEQPIETATQRRRTERQQRQQTHDHHHITVTNSNDGNVFVELLLFCVCN
jgi:hypothetical protein